MQVTVLTFTLIDLWA